MSSNTNQTRNTKEIINSFYQDNSDIIDTAWLKYDINNLFKVADKPMTFRHKGIHRLMYERDDIPAFYINEKLILVYVAALILDISLTKGFASLVTSILNIESPQLIKIKDDAAKCILTEFSRNNQESHYHEYASYTVPIERRNRMHLYTPDDFFRGECINNHISCIHCKDGQCTLSMDDYDKQFSFLISKNIIKEGIKGYTL